MMDDLYNEGRDSLDEGNYAEAAKRYAELAQMAGPQTDAALYWKAYANNKLGKRDVALESIADLKKRFPQSRVEERCRGSGDRDAPRLRPSC